MPAIMVGFQAWASFAQKLQAHSDMPTVVTVAVGAVSAYATFRCIYLAYFHPLAGFPGPRIAAVSNIWYAYHWLSGRWPWAVEDALREYGDIVRIAPNELAVVTPQAFQELYGSQTRGLENWVKSDFQNRGKDLGGIVWEEDPVRHREVARKVAPAFTPRTIQAMEPVCEKHIARLIEKMKEIGSAPNGVGLAEWSGWYCMDLAADLTWNDEIHQMRDQKSSLLLDVILGINHFATVVQVFKRFPLISPLQYFFLPVYKLSSIGKVRQAVEDAMQQRVEKRGTLEHPDYFDFILPDHEPFPTNRGEVLHTGSVAVQVMLGSYSPMSDWMYSTLVFLTEDEECYKLFVAEIRDTFESIDDINTKALTILPYLHATLEESLRLLPNNNTGWPRMSPGATIEGQYIPKGTQVQSSLFSYTRSPRYFHEPLKFRPQRWLPSTHPLYDPAFKDDNSKGYYPFSMGPRGCVGRKTAWVQAKLAIAKLLWTFDVTRVPGQDYNLERDLLHFGFLEKPELQVRFVPVQRA